jgi:uncharacterized protein YndB with AHSA1/START domain
MQRRTLMKTLLGTAVIAAVPSITRTEETAVTAKPGDTEIVRADVIVERLFDAPVERVWRAFTEDAEVMKWWGPEHFTSPAAKMDVRVGGTSLVCMRTPDGRDMWMTWAYTKVEPKTRIEYVQNISDAEGRRIEPSAIGMGPDFPRDVATVVTLAPRGNRTAVRIVEDTTTSQFMHEMSRLGLEQCMDKMAASFAA